MKSLLAGLLRLPYVLFKFYVLRQAPLTFYDYNTKQTKVHWVSRNTDVGKFAERTMGHWFDIPKENSK